MKISIKDMLHKYAATLNKNWKHDRSNTIGASEVGACLRKTWFAKNDTAYDEDYQDNFGAILRGNVIEEHYWVPGLRASLPEGVRLLYAGEDQQTLVDGYLSATTDGLLTGVSKHALTWKGIDDIGSDCLNLDCKSIDPRVDLTTEKAEHSFQVQTQMGLIRFATPYKPNYSILSYVDASFWDVIPEFVVKFNPRIYKAAHERAARIMNCDDALKLPAEGKTAGGKECDYCPWASACAHISVAGVPKQINQLDDDTAMRLKELRDRAQALADSRKEVERDYAEALEAIKDLMREHGTRKYKGLDWGVTWFPVKGKESLDKEAIEKAGIDLSSFMKPGKPGEQLRIT
jgi:hypothetical protein